MTNEIALVLAGAAAGLAIQLWRKKGPVIPEKELERAADEDDDETEDFKTRPADPEEWKMRPERFPPGVTYAQINADIAKGRKKIPGSYGGLKGTSASSQAAGRAQGLLGSLPFGTTTSFEIDGEQFMALKEWHSPHIPPIGPPHRWHHGISVFQKR